MTQTSPTTKYKTWRADQLAGQFDDRCITQIYQSIQDILERGDVPRQPSPQPRDIRPRQPRRPTLARVAKQARKAGLEVARYEIKPDGTVVVVAGQPQANDTEINPWDQVFTNASKRPS